MDNRFLAEVAAYLESLTGLKLPNSNLPQLKRTLSKMAATSGLSHGSLFSAIRSDLQFRQKLINSVMIGETYFFREASQFRLLRSTLIPKLAGQSKRLCVWSVSCSTGEEAVSLASLLDEYCAPRKDNDFIVYATDINDAALERLKSGVFPHSSLRRDGKEFHEPFIKHHVLSDDGMRITIHPRLMDRIKVKHFNFYLDPLSSIPEDMDLVFFRNTLIYAPLDKRDAIVSRIAAKLRPEGALFLATSELPFIKHPQLRVKEIDKVYFLSYEKSKKANVEATRKEPLPKPKEDRRKLGMPGLSKDMAVPMKSLMDEILDQLKGEAGQESDHVTVELIRCFFQALNSNDLRRAVDALERLKEAAAPGMEALLHFCSGKYYILSGDPKTAIAELNKAVDGDGKFWPARFYRASLEYEVSKRRAKRDFDHCIALMDKDMEEGKERYAFFLEGFNTAYFRHMAVRWIEKLSKDEEAVWH